ncbi:hypothetical protein KAH81_04365 [bacterium]|nr:hypothetical protein [bacterium]
MFNKTVILLFFLSIFCGSAFAQAKENPFGGGSEVWEQEATIENMPSKWTAAGLSLLVPGAGQLYLGKKNSARYFLAAEGSIWGAFAGYTVYGNWRKEDYHNYAAIHAGVNPSGKDNAFFETLLDFNSRDTYNYWMHLIYRDEVPLYPTTDEYFWEWESNAAMDEYASIRESSEKAYRTARTILGVALINRVFSVVDIFRTDVYSLRSGDGSLSDNGDFMPQAYVGTANNGSPTIGLRFVKNF